VLGGLYCGEDSYYDILSYDTVQSGRFVTTFQRKILTPVYHEDGGRTFICTLFDNNGEFWVLQQCKGDISSSGMLRSEDWWLTTFRDNLAVPS